MTTRVAALNGQQAGQLWEGAGIGGLIGSLLGRPILGALGGLAYKLLSNDGLKDGANKLVGNFLGVEDPLSRLGSVIGGSEPADKKSSKKAEAESGEEKSGMPTWAKIGLGIAGAVVGVNVVESALSIFGTPFFNGFGLGFPMGMPGIATSGNYYMDQMMMAQRQMMPFWMG